MIATAHDRTATALERAVRSLLDQARMSFEEATHEMPFPRAQGFRVSSDVQAGDVFQRAVLLECLADIHARGRLDLSDLLSREANYLLSRQRAFAPGGWSYFPDLEELPVDTDDLAQVIRALLAAGRSSEAREASAAPLQTLLEQPRDADGLFETWIVPPGEDPRHVRQRWWIDHAWGRGPDIEVIANLVVALRRLDPRRYADVIRAGQSRIVEAQDDEVGWRASWYHGPFYPGWLATLALPEGSASVTRWRARLEALQRADGGWGWGACSDAQSTALAILTLGPSHPARKAGRDWLVAAQDPDGFWPGSLWIRMELGRASRRPHTVVSYGSRTIGAAYAIQALLDLQELPA